jgi:serine protease Do
LSATSVPSGIKFAKLGDSDKVKIGEDVIVIGFPMGLSYSLSKGIISGSINHKNQINEGNQAEYFQTDASINTGNSGGPMFNMDGEVIGIVSSILSRSGGFEGVGFVTKINLAKKLLFDDKGFWMGIDGQFLSEQMAEILNVPESGGMMITTVTPNSPGYFLGLRGGYLKAQIGSETVMLGGDIILSVDGLKLNSMENIEKIWKSLDKKKTGDEINFQVMRAGYIKDYKWIIK